MLVNIFQPTKSAMQSGVAKSNIWLLEYSLEQDSRFIEPIMGWVGSDNTETQVKLKFNSLEDAIYYAKDNNLDYNIKMPKKRKVKPKSYSSNFI